MKKYRKTTCTDYLAYLGKFISTGFIATVIAVLVASHVNSKTDGNFSVELDIRALLITVVAISGVSCALGLKEQR